MGFCEFKSIEDDADLLRLKKNLLDESISGSVWTNISSLCRLTRLTDQNNFI